MSSSTSTSAQSTQGGSTTSTSTELETDAQGLPKLDHEKAPPATLICEKLKAGTPLAVIHAVTSLNEVNILPAILPTMRGIYKVILPQGKTSYIPYNVVLWDSVQQITMSEGVAYRLLPIYGSDDFFPKAAPSPIAPTQTLRACPRAPFRTKHRYFQHWVPVTIEFSAQGPREILLMGHLSPLTERELRKMHNSGRASSSAGATI